MNITSPSFPNGLPEMRSEQEVRCARLSMVDVINRGAQKNAHLIDAAPMLLQALNELLEQIECLSSIEYSRDVEPYKAEACWDDAIRRAQDAIAKATGKP